MSRRTRPVESAHRWFAAAVSQHDFLISEVADYELRRELIRIRATRSLARLDAKPPPPSTASTATC